MTAPRWFANPSIRVWGGFALAAVLLFAVAPAVLSDFRLNLLAKFLCFAIVAAGIGLAWGRGGMLTLGQGVFFGLGAYIMAMHLQMADAARLGNDVPDFMEIAGIRELPAYWQPFASAPVAIIAILVLPALVAAALGYGVFKRRVKGAYFAILSQAMAAALAILLTGQQTIGGFTGLSDFRAFFGFKLSDPLNRQMLFFIAAGTLLVVVAVVRQLMHSRYGELLVAVRDQEERVRFLGYDPANVKIVAYVVAAFFAGIAGALFTPIVGIISPADIGVVPSIAFLIGVAIGGRTTLLGPVLGAIGVAWAQTALSEQFPSGWTYLQGVLFIVVVGFVPGRAGRTVADPAPRHRRAQTETRRQRAARAGAHRPVAGADRGEGAHPMIDHEPKRGGNAGMSSEYLEVRGLSVSFDGFQAVTDVDLTVLQGDLRFLIGPNGAGKTTLIDAITGLTPATGSAQKSGVELLGKKVHQIARLGVGRTFQTASVFEQLSVLQNLDIAAGAGRSALTLLRRRKSVLPSIEEALEITGLGALRDQPAGVLAHGQKQWLEIGMLLVQNASVLLLDEPVAGMSAEEREETGNLLRRIGGERVVVVVEHDMDFMRAFATSVTVLAGGRVLSEGTVEQVQADPKVQQVYLGTAAESNEESADARIG